MPPIKTVVIGAFDEILELAEECGCEIVGIIDRKVGGDPARYPILCDDEGVEDFAALLDGAMAVLTPDAPETRRSLYEQYKARGFRIASLVSPNAKVSNSARLGEGVVLQWGTNVSAGSIIGCCVKLNTGANIMHDTVVGEFSTFAPNSVILGRVQIGSCCYVGANATILPGLKVGDHSIIGAGAVVTKDVAEGMVVAGNPARVLRRREFKNSTSRQE